MKTDFTFKERIFNDFALGKLQEITSVIECECPNQVSTIVNSLSSFEEYSKKCTNRNAKDAEIHKLLFEKTSQARVIMEEALKAICDFEDIVISDL